MSILKVYSGYVSVKGRSEVSSDCVPFYDRAKNAYGVTLGELADNLVAVAQKMSNDAFEWMLLNRSASYEIQDDYWTYAVVQPNIINCFMDEVDLGTLDNMSGGSLDDVSGIVRAAVLSRDINVQFLLSELSLIKAGESALPRKAAVPFSDIYEAESISSFGYYGFNGAELDNILDIAKEEGRLDMLISSRQNASYIHSLRVKEADRKAKKEAKRKERLAKRK